MVKVNDEMLKKFLTIMEDYDEFIFGTDEEIKNQLEICLNSQGYWSACSIRVYYNKETNDFSIEKRF